MFFSIPNDFLLYLSIFALLLCVLLDVYESPTEASSESQDTLEETSNNDKQNRKLKREHKVRRRFRRDYTRDADAFVPVHYGRTCGQHVQTDVLRLSKLMPENVVRARKYLLQCMDSTGSGSPEGKRRSSLEEDIAELEGRASSRQSPMGRMQGLGNAGLAAKRSSLMVAKLPYLQGCEPDSEAAQEMKSRYPDATIADIVRFLVARKGDVALAAEMYEKATAWHKANLPLKRSDEVMAAMQTRCFFPFGKAKDGTPILYFRGALYDNTKASPECYVLAAAHAIEYALRNSSEINVTVLVHTNHVPGAPNASADMGFIKGFISTLSDNFPERLKRLAIYPFPWYGRAIWSVLKVFVDKRTQEKVSLLSYSGNGVPDEVAEFVDPREMPECCGGLSKQPIIDLIGTLVEDLPEEEAAAEEKLIDAENEANNECASNNINDQQTHSKDEHLQEQEESLLDIGVASHAC